MNSRKWQRWLFTLVLIGAGSHGSAQVVESWVDDTFADFIQGTFDAAGQNLYVSAAGRVQVVNRFDLNNDRWIDLVFNQTHDTSNDTPTTILRYHEGTLQHTLLEPGGASRVVDADLDGDGLTDLLLCSNRNGIQGQREMLTVVWGQPNGWSMSRSTGLLPVQSPRDVAIADLNRDGRLDLCALSFPDDYIGMEQCIVGHRTPNMILRVYWGTADGYTLVHRSDYQIPYAAHMVAADLDSDGFRELIIAGRDGGLWLQHGKLAEVKELGLRQLQAADSPRVTALAAGNSGGNDGAHVIAVTTEGVAYRVPEFKR